MKIQNTTTNATLTPTLKILKAARTIFYVTDFDKAYAFYTQILGLAPAYPAEGGWAEFTLGDTSLCIHSGREGTSSTKHVASYSFAVADFDAAYAFLKEKGVKVGDAFKPCGDLRVADFYDPSGNALAIEG